MTLLELRHVSKHHRRGSREHVVLRHISLTLGLGELVTIWGTRRSGRSTLLRIAAGVESPDSGCVLFGGRDLADCGEEMLGSAIGYCHQTFCSDEGTSALEQLIVGLLARGMAPTPARLRAREALAYAGAERCGALAPYELDSAEAVRVSIARTLTFRPQLIVIDEPISGVDLPERDDILLLLRSLADEGMAVLASTREAVGLAGADRALALSEGELRGDIVPKLAPVVSLHRPAGRRATA
jgi:ABC-type lipoprotein export system ATPase subunit